MDPVLQTQHAINWLKRRFGQSAKIQYLHSHSQLQQHLEIQKCFKRFDEDNSGTLSIYEIYQMLKSIGRLTLINQSRHKNLKNSTR